MAIRKNESPIDILGELLGDNDELEFRGVRLEAKKEPVVLEFNPAILTGGGGIPPALVAHVITHTVQHMLTRTPAIAQQTLADFASAMKK